LPPLMKVGGGNYMRINYSFPHYTTCANQIIP
jgi:hypothetical protein